MRAPHVLFCLWLGLLSLDGAQVRFAILGDFGTDNAAELAVANLIKTNFQPEFVVTVGDNNYLGGANIDRAIGKYYHEFIGNYVGSYGTGAVSNRFFTALGNHDYDTGGFAAYTNYFTLPGNERYYDFVRGPVHFFIVNSDTQEPHGTTATSTQALWFSNRLASSAAPWRLVIAQDPPYSSTSPASRMRWPFPQWRASAVISGHAHQYERIMTNDFPYIVNGAGGADLVGFGTPVSGSVLRYNTAHGALKVIATETNLTWEFWSVAGGGTLIDRFTQILNARLTATWLTNRLVRVNWPTNGHDGFVLQSCNTLPPDWVNVTNTPSIVSSNYTVTLPTTGQMFRAFRLRR